MILRPSKTKRRGFTYNCGFLHLLTPETASKRPHRINFSSPNKFFMSKVYFKTPKSIFSAFSHGFFSPSFYLVKRVTKKKNFFFVTRFLLIKRGSQKSMTEMPEDASNGLKMKFGHQEFDPRKKNDVLWTFRGCFRG